MAYTDIDKPSDYFNTKLYSADATNTINITGVGHQPDWVWIKRRNGASDHVLFDSVRGTQKGLFSSLTNAEATEGGNRGLTSFDSDGFTIGPQLQDISGSINAPGGTYVSWNWKAGTSFTNDASATGIGSIDSTGSVNTDAGFSIVSYTGNSTSGATVAHGLGVVPKVIIIKARDRGDNWILGHNSLGWTKYLQMNITNAANTATNIWNDTAPTSSVFTLGDNTPINYTDNFIAYCFAEKKGYSKFRSYTGNGNADGTFIYTGFKPAMILLKANAAGENWRIFDNKRSTFNPNSTSLQPNSSNAEASNTDIDFCSNGIKLRTTSGEINPNGTSFIYMAFAESPFVTSTGIPTTTR